MPYGDVHERKMSFMVDGQKITFGGFNEPFVLHAEFETEEEEEEFNVADELIALYNKIEKAYISEEASARFNLQLLVLREIANLN